MVPTLVANRDVMRLRPDTGLARWSTKLLPMELRMESRSWWRSDKALANAQFDRGRTQEIDTLAATLEQMAEAIADELRRRDLTQAELRAARDAAEAAAAAKGMFLANMSHEIRTPMNAIMGMTQLALGTELDPRQRDYLKKASDASAHLLGLINDVLDFSKIEAGGMLLEAAPFHLESVVAQAVALVRQRAAMR